MKVPLSWVRDHVEIADLSPRAIAGRLTDAGLQVERVDDIGADITNVVVARVLDIEELTGFKKPIRWVTLIDGAGERQVICGATNFAVGDVVAYARPPASLPGGFIVDRRKTYGRESDGMICSPRELGIGEDHAGILVLGHGEPADLPLGADVVEAAGLRDAVLDIAVNPDRGYALSVRGVAREVATAFGLAFRDPADVAAPAAADGDWPVRVDDPAACDRYLMRAVTGLDPAAPSPQWLQRRLSFAGMRPISLAVDVTNHVMLDLGQPLHAFDRAKVQGGIVVRRAAPGEQLRTLDGNERSLHGDDIVIADDSGAIGLAGVMGGESTEIGEATTDLLIEAAHFDPVSIAWTARRHRLGSEASRRFERGVDDALPPAAAQVAVELLTRLGGAADGGAPTDIDSRPPRPVIRLAATLPARLSGLAYPTERVVARLGDVGCTVAGGGGEVLEVTPPSWRPDLQRPVDLVEEVVRLEGYANLPVTVPRAPAGRGLTRRQRQRRQVGRALAGAGYVEVLSPPFVADNSSDTLLLPEGDERRPSVRLANPIADDQPWLRGTLLPGLLAALARNVGRGLGDIELYETGTVFRRRPGAVPMPRPPAGRRPDEETVAAMDAALPAQPLHLAVALTGRWERAGWWGTGREAIWADAVAAARVAAQAVEVELQVRADPDHAPWHPGRCAALLVGDTVVGHAGELHPRVVEAFGLPPRACALELDLEPVLAAAPDVVVATPLSVYPPVAIDVAVVVGDDVPVADVASALRAGAGGLLESMRLFDVYRGGAVGAGRVSYAFALRLRAPDRTLTSDEANGVRDAAVAEAARRVGAALRA